MSRHNQDEGQNEEIPGMNLNINAIEACTDIPECMMAEEIRHATCDNDNVSIMSAYMIKEWPSTKANVKELQPYWPFTDNIAVTGRATFKGRRIIMPSSLHQRAQDQLHVNQMGIEETGLSACVSIYWININNDIDAPLNISCIF